MAHKAVNVAAAAILVVSYIVTLQSILSHTYCCHYVPAAGRTAAAATLESQQSVLRRHEAAGSLLSKLQKSTVQQGTMIRRQNPCDGGQQEAPKEYIMASWRVAH
eukprot:2953035-Pleurochrysis_carterae.AAC.3